MFRVPGTGPKSGLLRPSVRSGAAGHRAVARVADDDDPGLPEGPTPALLEAPHSQPSNRHPVLYVEDMPMNFRLVSLRLGSRYDLIWARNADEAVTHLIQTGPDLCAILMDIELQGSALDGIALTSAIRGIGPRPAVTQALPQASTLADIPIIFVTGYEGQYDAEQVAAVGGDAMLGKPINFSALEAAIARLGRGLTAATE